MGRNQTTLCVAAVALGLLTCLVQDGASKPFVERSLVPLGSSSSEGTPSGNDAGPVDSCVQPQSSSVCMLDYEVPQSLAIISAAIELEIEDISADEALYRSDECAATARAIMCAQRFPRCEKQGDREVQVLLTSLNCEEMVRESCSTDVANVLVNRDFCDLQNSSLTAAECKSLTEHENTSMQEDRLQHCTQDMQRKVTGWMYELMRYYDTRFGLIAEEIDGLSKVCFEQQANFTCQLLGQCSEDGQRVEILNTYESCEKFINCFPEAHAERLRDFYDCSHWPHEVKTAPSTPATPATPATLPSTWPAPPERKNEQVVGGGSPSHHRLSLLALTIAPLALHHILL